MSEDYSGAGGLMLIIGVPALLFLCGLGFVVYQIIKHI